MSNVDNNAGLDVEEAQVIGKNAPEETDDAYVGKVKVINALTGEVMEREYSGVHEIKNVMQELSASKLALDKALNRLKFLLEQFMAKYDEYQFADGDKSYWVTPERRKINYTDVATLMGEEVASLVSEVSITKLKEYLTESVKRHEMTHEEADAVLQQSYPIKGSSYVKIGKAK
jgi:hypothetical protein